MEQTPDFSRLIKIAGSSSGQNLIQLLKKTGGDSLEKAIALAASGNYAQAKQLLSALLETPEAKKILRQLEEENE